MSGSRTPTSTSSFNTRGSVSAPSLLSPSSSAPLDLYSPPPQYIPPSPQPSHPIYPGQQLNQSMKTECVKPITVLADQHLLQSRRHTCVCICNLGLWGGRQEKSVKIDRLSCRVIKTAFGFMKEKLFFPPEWGRKWQDGRGHYVSSPFPHTCLQACIKSVDVMILLWVEGRSGGTMQVRKASLHFQGACFNL